MEACVQAYCWLRSSAGRLRSRWLRELIGKVEFEVARLLESTVEEIP
jgi:hypothetical protein